MVRSCGIIFIIILVKLFKRLGDSTEIGQCVLLKVKFGLIVYRIVVKRVSRQTQLGNCDGICKKKGK